MNKNCVLYIFSPSLQVMVTNVTSLLKTVKAVEDEATRGTRALEATIECIKQEMAVRMDGELIMTGYWNTSLTLHVIDEC